MFFRSDCLILPRNKKQILFQTEEEKRCTTVERTASVIVSNMTNKKITCDFEKMGAVSGNILLMDFYFFSMNTKYEKYI